MTMEAERDGEEQRRPLLSSSSPPPPPPAAEHQHQHQQQYQYLGRSSSSALRGGGGGGGGGAGWGVGPEVSAAEVRSAASISSASYYPPPPALHHDVYPPDIHSPSPSPAAPTAPHPHGGLAIVPQGPYPYGGEYQPSHDGRRDVLDEVEIRQLLIDHVGHRCCWGSRPARTWKITSIEDCNVYVGTLETFIEERDTVTNKEPYDGGKIDGRDKGPVLAVWELDLRSEFPLLFVPEKEVMVKIPHSEVIEKCLDCESRGEIPCPICNAGQEHGFYKANQMTRCSACHGRGLLAHQDGSDTVCGMCSGKGMLPCIACGSRGLVTCKTCSGYGSLLAKSTAHVRCNPANVTLSARKVSATRGAASVPDEVFHRAQGIQLCNIQAYQCTPAFFADSYQLNQFSSEVVASRLPVPPSARVISERHIISVVPVIRVTMAHRKQCFSFYVVGYNRDVFIRDYPSKFCWGLCCCFEWLRN
uniref:CR-type domain-containing protein n=1 Tax=Oryza nivara TaxID=4536 RepID=A0A0E0FWW8_ORYNI